MARPLEGAPESFVFSLESLYARLCQLTDQRQRRGVRYPLAFVLTVMTLAKLAGADKPCAIADWVAERAGLWVKVFELKRPNMPSHHTYWRALQRAVRPEDWEQAVGGFLAALPQAGPPVQLTLAARRCAAR